MRDQLYILGFEAGKRKFLNDELRFLKTMRYIVKLANLDNCHGKYKPLEERIKQMESQIAPRRNNIPLEEMRRFEDEEEQYKYG